MNQRLLIARRTDHRKEGPFSGEAFKFAPMRDDKLLSWVWSIWVQRDEIYAVRRSLGDVAKISIHKRGQMHLRRGHKDLVIFQDASLIDSGPWKCAYELRFLLDASSPRPIEKALKAKDEIHGIPVPLGHALCVAVFVGPREATVPSEARPVWRSTTKDGRHVAIDVRQQPFSEADREIMVHLDAARVSLKEKPGTLPYVEQMVYSRPEGGGNLLYVRPVPHSSFRWPGDRVDREIKRTFVVAGSNSFIPLFSPAPSNLIGFLIVLGASSSADLSSAGPVTCKVATVQLVLIPGAIRAGEAFKMGTVRFRCPVTVAGVTAHDPDLAFSYMFDGKTLALRLHKASFVIQNANRSKPVDGLPDAHEIEVVVSSPETVVMKATNDAPGAQADLGASFWLRQS